MIDLRSDTVTLPTPAMREAIYRAELGDDVFDEDPTVNKLEEMAAEKMGKEAALLVTSGTMGNLVGVVSHCQRGDEVIMGAEAHVFHYEVASCAVIGGLQTRIVPNPRGRLLPQDVEAAIRPDNIHQPRTSAVCLENTHNRCGGVAITVEDTNAVCAVAHRHGLPVHLDGARIFNAAVFLGVEAKELVAQVDSVTFCLSKGLACPVGSVLCGSAEYIKRAQRIRKMVGGSMRQAGIIAAAGIVALEQMIDRLADDHHNARILAEGLAEMKGIEIDLSIVETNLVFFNVTVPGLTDASFAARLAKEGVLCLPRGKGNIRMATHYGIETEHIYQALAAIKRVLDQAGTIKTGSHGWVSANR